MKKIVTGALFVVVLLGAWISLGRAQQARPRILLTWRAGNFAPAGFSGKILPIPNSPIEASFELIEQGVPVNLSRQTVYWYLNGELVAGGEGVQTVRFSAPKAGDTADLRVQLPNYKGELLVKTVSIPTVRPEVVIEPAFPDNRFSTRSIQLKAVPYFFNVANESSLVFSWNVNDQSPSNAENPDTININLPASASSNFRLTIQASAQNPVDVLEGAARAVTLTFVP